MTEWLKWPRANLDCFFARADNTDGVCPHQESDIQRCEARELPGWAAGKQKAAHHSHHWLWSGQRVHRPWDQKTHPLPGAQESDWDGTLHEHQHAPGKRWESLRKPFSSLFHEAFVKMCLMCNLYYTFLVFICDTGVQPCAIESLQSPQCKFNQSPQAVISLISSSLLLKYVLMSGWSVCLEWKPADCLCSVTRDSATPALWRSCCLLHCTCG